MTNDENKKKIPRGRNGSPPVKPPRIYRGCLIVNLEWLKQHPKQTLASILKTASH